MAENIFLQLSILLALTVTIAFFMRLLRQPLIVAYIVAGLIAGPLFLHTSYGGQELFDAFAQFGIVLLLFVVGLSLNFDYVKRVGASVLAGGALQFAATAALGFAAMRLLNFPLVPSVFVAVAITFSSTIIVVKLLSDKRDLESVYGRYVVGLLLIQDIIAVAIMIFLTTSRDGGELWYATIAVIAGKLLLLAGLVFLMAKYILPLIMDHVARSGEFMFIFTIAWCFGVASLVYWSGFSIEIGAVIAGISLGASPYQREISSRVRPLRDFFIVLFFIVLGSELQLADIAVALPAGLLLSLFVLVADPLVLFFVMRRLRYTRRNSFLAAVTAAQVSEFGFILAFKGREVGYLQGVELEILTVVALITIVVSSYLIEYNEQLYQKVMPFLKRFGKDTARAIEEGDKLEHTVWVFGYHRLGWKVCEALAQKRVKFAMVDFDPRAIAKAKHRGIPSYFGDAADVEFLDLLPLEKASMIVSTIPEVDDQITLINNVRKRSKKTLIISTLYHSEHLRALYDAGADYVILPHLVGGSWLAGVLKNKPWTRATLRGFKKEQVEELRLRFSAEADA